MYPRSTRPSQENEPKIPSEICSRSLVSELSVQTSFLCPTVVAFGMSFLIPLDETAVLRRLHSGSATFHEVQCKDCEEDYIVETARPAFEIRLKEHYNIRKASTTAVDDHLRDAGTHPRLLFLIDHWKGR